MDRSKGQVDGSRGLTDGSRAQVDASDMSNSTETADMSHGDDLGTYQGSGGMKRLVHEPDGCRHHLDASSICMDVHSVRNDKEMAVNEMQIVRMPRIDLKTQNSPTRPEIVMAKPIGRWRNVSVEDIEVYIPWNAPVEALG